MRERDLLEHIYRANPALPGHVVVGPGDDMGMIRVGDQEVLITVDQVSDGVHFKLAETPIDKIGRKAITRNLSDVAAMAAKPIGAVAAASLPTGFSQAQADQLFDAMRSTAQYYDCPLFGGDIAVWDGPLTMSVTVLAQGEGITPVLRSGAKVGDAVYVTGKLGASYETVDGYAQHLDFEPRIKPARQLAAKFNIHAMIDISDGLACDLGHVCSASNVAAQVMVDELPISAAANLCAQRKRQEVWQCALGDGEDYELCFTVDAKTTLPGQIDGLPITQVGLITPIVDGPTITLKLPNGTTCPGDELGWEHRTT